MVITNFIIPAIILTIMIVWLYVGKKFIKTKPNLGFGILAVYIFFSTHSCMMQIEDNRWRPDFNYNSSHHFELAENKNYKFIIINHNGEEYVKVSPWSDNLMVFFIYNLYRLFLLHSYLPEYIFNMKGKLVDWTDDSHDDPKYQDSWGRSKEIREVSYEEYLEIINT